MVTSIFFYQRQKNTTMTFQFIRLLLNRIKTMRHMTCHGHMRLNLILLINILQQGVGYGGVTRE